MEEHQLVPYGEVNIGTDNDQNDIQLLQNGAIVIRKKSNEISDINKNIKELRETIKQLKNEKDSAEKEILPIMIKRGIECINVTNGSIKYSESYKPQALNKKNIRKILISFFTDEKNLIDLCNFNNMSNIERATKQSEFIIDYINTVNKKKKIVTLKTSFT